MFIIEELLSNFPLMCTIAAWFLAQFVKVIVTLVKEKKFKPQLFVFSLGGMPSSHSACVCSLATACAIKCGLSSPEFAISVLLAMVVMTDAMGVRWQTGEQSKIINKIVKELLSGDTEIANTALKELVGHTPFQVMIGANIGIALPFILLLLER